MFSTISTYSALQDSKIEGLETMATRFQVGILLDQIVVKTFLITLRGFGLYISVTVSDYFFFGFLLWEVFYKYLCLQNQFVLPWITENNT